MLDTLKHLADVFRGFETNDSGDATHGRKKVFGALGLELCCLIGCAKCRNREAYQPRSGYVPKPRVAAPATLGNAVSSFQPQRGCARMSLATFDASSLRHMLPERPDSKLNWTQPRCG